VNLSRIAVALCAYATLVSRTAAPAQVHKGRLDHLGGPARLLRLPLSSTQGLRPPDDSERHRWQPAFRGEEISRGPSQQWLGSTWTLRLAAVNDTVYRVTLETFTSDRTEADRLLMALDALLTDELGSSNQEECSDFRWFAEDGDAFLRTSDVAEGRRTTVVFTSAAIRTFTPL
jgi:hypothetical protein